MFTMTDAVGIVAVLLGVINVWLVMQVVKMRGCKELALCQEASAQKDIDALRRLLSGWRKSYIDAANHAHAMAEAIRSVEWSGEAEHGDRPYKTCPSCGGYEEDRML